MQQNNGKIPLTERLLVGPGLFKWIVPTMSAKLNNRQGDRFS